MPPKIRITSEMIVDAGFEVIRETGVENMNARTIAQKLGCSTQPVMYQFKKIEDIKKAVYQKADTYHTEYITNMGAGFSVLEMGLAYVRFGAVESNLFRFLFQSDMFDGKSLSNLIESEDLMPVIAPMSIQTGLSIEQTRKIFRFVFLFAHGYASMFANNAMDYDEEIIKTDLKTAMAGMVTVWRENQDEEG